MFCIASMRRVDLYCTYMPTRHKKGAPLYMFRICGWIRFCRHSAMAERISGLGHHQLLIRVPPPFLQVGSSEWSRASSTKSCLKGRHKATKTPDGMLWSTMIICSPITTRCLRTNSQTKPTFGHYQWIFWGAVHREARAVEDFWTVESTWPCCYANRVELTIQSCYDPRCHRFSFD